MKIGEILKHINTSISFEFFPPKTPEGEDQLFRTIKDLEKLNPTFVSVTYGAGGSTRERTIRVVKRIHEQCNLTVMAHLTCIGHSKKEIYDILKGYKDIGIQNILALRGDIPQGQEESFVFPPDGCRYANELVSFIREQFGDYFSIGVAAYPEGHPESPSLEKDIYYFKKKVEAGAEFAITQMFFDNSYFYRYMDLLSKEGINIPVIPGIMPITNFRQIEKFAVMCGATIPKDLVEKLEKVENSPEEVAKIGIDYATEQCEDLLKNGVKGLHFYTLNKSKATVEIYRRIKDLIK
ncbi:MAG TPA: methylenetetrahydrofolate reductase [NAD(P)H] [Persephonella sp.]|uniref:Methylenetetrahydrofolate reductase n=1 Tax=Persephonella marina (strain DSM 14350 / EX-H1) TaxID=123214 RepID=C0QT51_PERMH|nr:MULTISPECIES: methylenetetrahydrofolate reductase [NAD(P)H] [Persephonella]ACO04053.1 5,10-methylenetetrahydrofolate reductase [Persephonella marina EX-H1]HCB70515.1 methylenetetrahydrofolate reductase [NAD(P)H] [Persephonella sp.]